MKKGIFSALDLANYLNYLYYNIYKVNISSLKLQKVLFFLFAEWGGFVKKSEIQPDNDGSYISKYDSYLFKENIEAWVYGPVVREVYDKFRNEKNDGKKMFIDEKTLYVKNFIDDLSQDLFKLSDFRLVELSHQTKCWFNSFKIDEKYHNNIIDKDDIINEFAFEL